MWAWACGQAGDGGTRYSNPRESKYGSQAPTDRQVNMGACAGPHRKDRSSMGPEGGTPTDHSATRPG